jgi:ABC-type transport system involved in multi-copper enzyme maturation permease subunit
MPPFQMTFLPIVERELRVASRRRWTYWGRAGAGGALLLVAGWILLLRDAWGSSNVSHVLFGGTVWLAFAFAISAGGMFSSDSISRERREGTLGLLFLTDLKGYDIALGKLVSTSINAIYFMLAGVPVLAIALLLGGITGGEYARMVLTLLMILLLSLITGLLASTYTSDARRAAGMAMGLMILMLGIFPGLAGLIIWRAHISSGADASDSVLVNVLLAASPVSPMIYGRDGLYKGGTVNLYWTGILCTAVMTAIALSLAIVRLPVIWQDRPLKEREVRGSWLTRLRWPTIEKRTAFRKRLLQIHPMVWLMGRHWVRPWVLWVYIVLIVGSFGGLAWHFGRDVLDMPGLLVTSILLHYVLKGWIANEAPRQFEEDRRTGALELLACTNLSAMDIIQGHQRALIRMFGVPVGFVCALDVFFLVYAANNSSIGLDGEFVAIFIGRIVVLVLDVAAIAWTGMLRGLAAPSRRSGSAVMSRIVVLPWIIFGVLLTFAGLSGFMLRGGFGEIFGLWMFINVVVSIYWMARSRTVLLTRFREYAVAPLRT